jgi:hypothetical protein
MLSLILLLACGEKDTDTAIAADTATTEETGSEETGSEETGSEETGSEDTGSDTAE